MDTRKHKIIYMVHLLNSPSRGNTLCNYFFLQLEPLRYSFGEYDSLSGTGPAEPTCNTQAFVGPSVNKTYLSP